MESVVGLKASPGELGMDIWQNGAGGAAARDTKSDIPPSRDKPYSPELTVCIRSLTGFEIVISCYAFDTIETIKELVFDMEGIPQHQQRFIFNGQQLENGKTLVDYKISHHDMIHLVLHVRGGGTFQLPVDLSNPSLREGEGRRGSVFWRGYSRGFNILGRCTNPTCISKGRKVCVNLKYPKGLILTDGKNAPKCPACFEAPVITRTYLVADARAKLTFRKMSSDQLETLILESPSNDRHFYTKLLDDQLKEGQLIGYSFLEITVVRFGMSFNNCQSCFRAIKISNEKVMACGHAFHKRCLLKNGHCPVCHVPKRKNVLPAQFENLTLGDNKILTIGLQQSLLLENLPTLIQKTEVNDNLLDRMRDSGILSEAEATELKRIDDAVVKCRQLYKIVPTRESGVAKLKTALWETGQINAVVQLSSIDTMFNFLCSQ